MRKEDVISGNAKVAELELPKSWNELRELADECQAVLNQGLMPTPQCLYAKGAFDMYEKMYESFHSKPTFNK